MATDTASMRVAVYIILLALTSCTPDLIVSPQCQYIEITYDDHKAHLRIHSDAPDVTICRDYGRCFTYTSTYYECISMSADPGELITIITDGDQCSLIVPYTTPIHP